MSAPDNDNNREAETITMAFELPWVIAQRLYRATMHRAAQTGQPEDYTTMQAAFLDLYEHANGIGDEDDHANFARWGAILDENERRHAVNEGLFWALRKLELPVKHTSKDINAAEARLAGMPGDPTWGPVQHAARICRDALAFGSRCKLEDD